MINITSKVLNYHFFSHYHVSNVEPKINVAKPTNVRMSRDDDSDMWQNLLPI